MVYQKASIIIAIIIDAYDDQLVSIQKGKRLKQKGSLSGYV